MSMLTFSNGPRERAEGKEGGERREDERRGEGYECVEGQKNGRGMVVRGTRRLRGEGSGRCILARPLIRVYNVKTVHK